MTVAGSSRCLIARRRTGEAALGGRSDAGTASSALSMDARCLLSLVTGAVDDNCGCE